MKCFNNVLIASLLLILPFELISGRRGGGGGGSRPGGFSGSRPTGSRPTGSSFGSRPTSPSGFRPTRPNGSPVSRPTSPSRPTITSPANRPSSRPGFGSNFRPTSVVQSPSNPSPTFKPVTQSGTPTIPSGGGGYNYQGARPPTFAGGGSLVAAGLGGFIIGSFLYGGSHRNPSCGGGYGYGYYNGCNYGQVSQTHQCKAQIPMCRIPETIRSQWYTGSKTTVDILMEKSICTIANDFSPQPIIIEDDSSNITITTPAANLTLDECMNLVVSSGTCNARKLFIFDNVDNICGCCSESSRFSQTDFFSSTIYKFEINNDLERFGPPTQCISGSTMFWPKKTPDLPITDATISGGGAFVDERYQCSCGSCTTCGAPKVSYLDWAGPFSVPSGLALLAATGADTVYDPVDTCTCNEGRPDCPAVNGDFVDDSIGNSINDNVHNSIQDRDCTNYNTELNTCFAANPQECNNCETTHPIINVNNLNLGDKNDILKNVCPEMEEFTKYCGCDMCETEKRAVLMCHCNNYSGSQGILSWTSFAAVTIPLILPFLF